MTNVTVELAVTPRSEELSFWHKAAYAIGELGNSAGPGTIIPFWYLYFLTSVAHLDPALAGLSTLLGKLWDAVNDPLIGTLSDHTRTRWGRRRPYLLFGAVPFGVTFALLWIVPSIENQVLLALYFAFVYILFDTAFTFVGTPYNALIPELTLDYDERTSLLTYRMFVSIVAGLLTALLLGEFVFPAFPDDEEAAFMVIGMVCGAIFIIPVLITFLGTRERQEFQAKKAPSLVEGLRYVSRNKEWRYTLSMIFLISLASDTASAVFPFFLINWIGMSAGDSSIVLGIILASATLFLPLVLWLSRRTEKKTAFIIATASWATIMVGILLVPEGAVTVAYVVAALIGFGVASAHLLPVAMSTDVLEVDELMSGKRQEGIYSGFSVFVRKLSTALVLALVGLVLAWAGYVEGADMQAGHTTNVIRMLISVVPAILLIIACVIAWFYPLTRQRHAEICQELALRRSAQTQPE